MHVRKREVFSESCGNNLITHTLTHHARSKRSEINSNSQTPGSVTPLHHTPYHDYVDIVRLLLQHRADVKMADSDVKTPLHKVRYGDDSLMSGFENHSSTNGGLKPLVWLWKPWLN